MINTFSNLKNFDETEEKAFISWIALMLLPSAILFSYSAYILSFHVMLKYKNLSTYEYILEIKKKRMRTESQIIPKIVLKKENNDPTNNITCEGAGISIII